MPEVKPQVGVHSSDVLVWLDAAHGLRVPKNRLLYAARTGAIPRPFTTASGDCCWRENEMHALAGYFKAPRKQGRPKKCHAKPT